jgi:hypothetical protein
MYFRGSSNGNPNNEYGYNRVKLTYLSLIFPDIINAKFVGLKDINKIKYWWSDCN